MSSMYRAPLSKTFPGLTADASADPDGNSTIDVRHNWLNASPPEPPPFNEEGRQLHIAERTYRNNLGIIPTVGTTMVGSANTRTERMHPRR